MKKLILVTAALAMAVAVASCNKSSRCTCDNYQEGRILNSFKTTPDEYGVEECEDISGIVWYNGKNGLECY
ncbi:MAG: hypothetical protein J5701_05915 [Bacteroidales bacterium]|nr:hypothetical protein [Bacteroidales bacterium]